MRQLAISQFVDEDLLEDEYLDRDMARVIARKLHEAGYVKKQVDYQAETGNYLVTWYLTIHE